MQARCRLGFERRVDAAIYLSALKTKVGSQSLEHGVIATGIWHSLAIDRLPCGSLLDCVSGVEDSLRSGRSDGFDLGAELAQAVFAPSRDHKVRSLPSERDGGGPADSGAGSGD